MLQATADTTSRPPLRPGGFVCACLQITERQLLDTLSGKPDCSLRDLRRTLGAGDGCTACHDVLQQYLDADGRCLDRGAQPSCPPICSAR